MMMNRPAGIAVLLGYLWILRGAYGVITPCQNIGNSNDVGPFSLNFLWACDFWHAPHLVNAMILMVWTSGNLVRWLMPAIIGFLVSAMWELIEVIGVVIIGNYIIFIGVTNVGFENIVDVVLVDWAIQAALGIALGMMINWFWRPPFMWYGWYTHRSHFMQWFGWYVALVVPQIIFSFKIDDDPDAFPVGALITTLIQAIIFGFLIQHEPHKELVWKGWTERDRIHFWMGTLTIYYSFMLVVQFDFFYSSIIQVWLLWVIWMFVLAFWAWIDGRGEELLRIFDLSHKDKYTPAIDIAKRVGSIE